MIIDVVIETILPLVRRVLNYIFIQLLLNTVFYITGFALLLGITFGRYPKKIIAIKEAALDGGQGWIMLLGSVFWIVTLLVIFSH